MSISVSQAYRDMMLQPVLINRMVIVIDDGTTQTTLTDKDIVRESLSINWRATNNGALTLGACYAASLSFSSFVSVETGEEGKAITITPTIYYDVGNNEEQAIPLGVFRCTAPVVYSKTTYYECYDKMLMLDEQITSSTSGNPYSILLLACNKCGLTLGNTSNQITAMVNSEKTIYVDTRYVSTWRDVVAYIAMVLGGYAQIGRDGKLYIRQFHKTPDFTLAKKRRTATSFAGYHTTFAGIKCRFLAEQNFYPYEYIEEGKTGVIINLGDIPVISDTTQAKQTIVENIYNSISDLEYDPCEISMVGDPSIEVGDMITTKDREGYDRNILITSSTFVWRKESTIISEGANPKTGNVTTQTQRINQRIENTGEKSTVVTATYINGSNISVTGSSKTEITNLKFVTNKNLTAIFGAEIPVTASGDGYIEIEYSNNGVIGDTIKARVHEGYNLVTLVNHLYYEGNMIVNFKLKAKSYGIGSASAPVITIVQDTIRSYIFAQGIETEVPWDGIIVIDENVGAVYTAMQMYGLTEDITVTTTPNEQKTFDEFIAGVQTGVQMETISDTIQVKFTYGEHILKCGHYNRCGNGRQFAPSGGA